MITGRPADFLVVEVEAAFALSPSIDYNHTIKTYIFFVLITQSISLKKIIYWQDFSVHLIIASIKLKNTYNDIMQYLSQDLLGNIIQMFAAWFKQSWAKDAESCPTSFYNSLWMIIALSTNEDFHHILLLSSTTKKTISGDTWYLINEAKCNFWDVWFRCLLCVCTESRLSRRSLLRTE